MVERRRLERVPGAGRVANADVGRLGRDRDIQLTMLDGLGRPRHRLEHQLDVVRVYELRRLSAAQVAPTEHSRQRLRMPHDVEALVQEQGELTFLALQRTKCTTCCPIHN
jgi:hypothetical protein